MGNELCDAVSIQNEYKRFTINQDMSPQNLGDTVPNSLQTSPKNQQIPKESQKQIEIAKIEYKQHIIECKRKDVKYLKKSEGDTRIIAINGMAKVYSKNEYQLVFDGQLRDSKFNGFGKLYKEGRIVYEGQFKNNLFDGWGITSEYAGEFREGKYDGYGIYQEFENDDRKNITFYYEGFFQNGLYSGSGVLMKGVKLPVSLIDQIHANEGIFEFLNQQIQHEMNIIRLDGTKEIYIGQFSNGFRHGFGRLFTEKMEFSGQFSHNLYHGLGTIYNRTNEGKRVIQTVFRMGKEIKE